MTTTNTQRTARELTPAIGATVLVRFEQLAIEARVLDAKNTWNKVRLLIRPIAGGGEQWIELGRLVAEPTGAAQEQAEMESLVAKGSTWSEARYAQRQGLLDCQKHGNGLESTLNQCGFTSR